ncbi:MAG: Rpn family recombination-promoting nuclease/putative transposase [Lachnospiraceae bacterium]|nr:Rpn family recombination-promoting nuclease/putative transposase [Lachnospiraceae bacterium]
MKKRNMVPLQELNLADRFLFDEVMEDPQTHREVLSIILGKEIPPLERAQTEKEVRISSLARSIRLDVFTMDEETTVYDTEMQQEKKKDLAKRSRYYQGLIDTGILKPGIPDYELLNNTYIILIMTFDLFGYGKYCYTFKPVCQEVPGCILEDGATRIFLNTRGENDDEVSPELVEFLHYIENTTDQAAQASKSERLHRIHDRVREVRQSEKVGVRYMQAWEEKYYAQEEARELGLAEGLAEGREKGLAEGLVEGREKGLAEGRAEGREKGLAEGRADTILESIRNLMETLKLSADQAMEALKVPAGEREKYRAMI